MDYKTINRIHFPNVYLPFEYLLGSITPKFDFPSIFNHLFILVLQIQYPRTLKTEGSRYWKLYYITCGLYTSL
ncbi:hypothetical protein MtrunA17_Chr7g0217751 [Medicago truncatula]|uniref:Uncharacterized protein n=1 Tax=Medicago truncatula TaxID=3880 RepID=A0A396GT22_MEDTR|nr:hypothetical protein MtrunA17_Chr7g0217751 [Medicago truncatula]